jgi:hypothetical protein
LTKFAATILQLRTFRLSGEGARPERILLAGIEDAVWEDFPAPGAQDQRITPKSFEESGTAWENRPQQMSPAV